MIKRKLEREENIYIYIYKTKDTKRRERRRCKTLREGEREPHIVKETRETSNINRQN